MGISTYAYVWRRQKDAPARMTVSDVLEDAERLGVALVQLCDLIELEDPDAAWLSDIRDEACGRGLVLETGTKGVEVDHLARHLDVAVSLGSSFVRSMLSSQRGTPGLDEATASLRGVIPSYEAAGVVLGLETYEQFSTAELVRIVEMVGSSHLGITLDPGNSIARLEHPSDVAIQAAPHVVNLHVKDFAFTRKEGMIGFTFAGAPLGTGLLDYDALADVLDSHGRKVNHVIEHWLTRQETLAATCVEERRWVDDSVEWLRCRGRV